MTRLAGAILAVRQAVATVCEIQLESVPPDDDLVDDLCLDECEREGLALIIEERFGVVLAGEIWASALYRTAEALAEWVISKSEEAEWAEARSQQRKSA